MGRRSAKRKARADVASLIDQLHAQERAERAWMEMTAADGDEDVWGRVEEHLIHQPHEHNHRLRRWKFFGK